jgi:hypothetical protein
VAVLNVDGPDTLDQILLDLPIMKEHGQHVQVEVTPLRRYEDFAADVKLLGASMRNQALPDKWSLSYASAPADHQESEVYKAV